MEELYHIHKKNPKYDDMYFEGSVLEFGKEYNHMKLDGLNNTSSFCKDITTQVKDGKEYYVHNMVDIASFIEDNKLEDLSPEMLKKLKDNIMRYVINSKLNIREYILEEIRRNIVEKNPSIELPSRFKCMWATDEDSLEEWKKNLRTDIKEYEIYKILVEKTPFVSSNSLLPKTNLPEIDMYEQAYRYWNPTQKDLEKNDREYLIEGKVTLAKRIK